VNATSDPARAESPADRLRAAFELHELAVAMLAQAYRRRHPGAGEAEVEAAVLAWHARRPGAEHGDAEGRPVPWPREK
jgi:predicted RNA polymerase sigma factor